MEEQSGLSSSFSPKAMEMIMEYAPKLALSVAMILIGFWIIKRIRIIIGKSLERADFSTDITPFLISLIDIALKVLLFFSVAGVVGIDTASFIAVLAAAGFAVGLALQGSLGNFAAGIIILVFRPYKAGDWVEIQDRFGKVESIQIFNTILVSPGQKTLIIPNGQVIDGIVTNYSEKGFIRIELNVNIPYEESFPKIRKIISRVLQNTPKVLSEPEPEVGIEAFDSHSIIVSVRPYANPDDYWEVKFSVYHNIKKAFNEHNIKMAYSEGVELGPIGE